MQMNNKNILCTTGILLLTLLFSPCYANGQEIKVSDVLGDQVDASQTTTTQELDQQETERENDFLNQLLLDIPSQTDNPSHTLTFTDPSPDKKGVQLEIDGGSFKDITSPYSLPALSIGEHTLRFKFFDKYNTSQILEKEIVIIPRAPIINTPDIGNNKLTITGSGLANSQLILILASNEKIVTKQTDVDADGRWTITVEENIPTGTYSFIAYLRKYGFASNLSQPVTASIDKQIVPIITTTNNEIKSTTAHFSLEEINPKDLGIVVSENPDLLLVVFLGFVLGIIAMSLVSSYSHKHRMKKEIKKVEHIVKPKDNGVKGKTLFEKLTEDLNNKEKEGQKEEQKEVQKEELSTTQEVEQKVEPEVKQEFVSRIDFLKDFKKFDPDDEHGKENENIKVSLTSKN